MYLTDREFAGLRDVLGALTHESDAADLRREVGTGIISLLGADCFASYVWHEQAGRFDDRIQINLTESNLERYESYYQYRDPITRPLSRYRRATFVTEVLAQDELVRTEFFGDFLKADGLYYGLNYFAYDEALSLGDLRVWRHRRSGPFEENERQLLDVIGCSFQRALQRSVPRVSDTRHRLVAASVLTDREIDVALAVAEGRTDREIGQRLHLSYATVRTHLAHIFGKLELTNRTQLAQFVSSVERAN